MANIAKEANSIEAYPGFCSMLCIRELLLNPGQAARDASPSQSYPQQSQLLVFKTPFIDLLILDPLVS